MSPATVVYNLAHDMGLRVLRWLADRTLDYVRRALRRGAKRIKRKIRRMIERLDRKNNAAKCARLSRRLNFQEWRLKTRRRLLRAIDRLLFHLVDLGHTVAQRELDELQRQAQDTMEHQSWGDRWGDTWEDFLDDESIGGVR